MMLGLKPLPEKPEPVKLPEILPCPVCKSSHTVFADHTLHGHGDCTAWVAVKCNSCGISGPKAENWGIVDDEKRNDAIVLWNNLPRKTQQS